MKGGIYNDVRWVRVFQAGRLVFKLLDDRGQPLGNSFDKLSQLMHYVDWRKDFYDGTSSARKGDLERVKCVQQAKRAGLL